MTRKNPKNSRHVAGSVSVLLAALMLLQLGCKKTPPPPAAPPPTAVSLPKIVVQKSISTVKMAPIQRNQLDFSAKKDPFKPFVALRVATSAEQGKSKRDIKPLLPIHSFDVSQFRLIGTISDPKGNKAMVVDPSGKGYVLKVGMTIGKNEGKITRIDTSGVDVVEQFNDDNNKIRKESIRIPLLRKP
ncbi:type IV pilus assembly protein PilP [Trichlorobacter thiogenes]|uniref:Type IV pilus assembly protein PilP n=1 Tax=Trichlorobacter thiogenes TaxID=115783 RepID=A0A1T4RMT2_9BACT|nr:pilus assembly protein PilP [Trichlorobacter thiogenes]SKA17315.1 type IV pilus assembly protein PilP [Trichlorobacter thiogenes]